MLRSTLTGPCPAALSCMPSRLHCGTTDGSLPAQQGAPPQSSLSSRSWGPAEAECDSVGAHVVAGTGPGRTSSTDPVLRSALWAYPTAALVSWHKHDL